MLWKREKSFPSAVRWAYEKTGRYNVRARRLINGSGILFALNYSATQSHDREHNMLKKKKKVKPAIFGQKNAQIHSI